MILFSCRRVAEISSKELDARLKLTERLTAAAHRGMCGPCARYRVQLRAVDRAARELVRSAADTGDATLPPETKDHIRRQLAAADDGTGRATPPDISPSGNP